MRTRLTLELVVPSNHYYKSYSPDIVVIRQRILTVHTIDISLSK